MQFMRIGLSFVSVMKVKLVSIGRKDVDMDLKKKLLDLAEGIQYADEYELTELPRVLRRASEEIGKLELMNMELLERLEQSSYQPQSYSTDKVELYPISDRSNLKSQLDRLGVEYTNKDNTHRLRRKLQRALRG